MLMIVLSLLILQDEGLIDKYLGINIRHINKDLFELTQPFLSKSITSFLGIADGKTNEKLTPVGKPLLNKDLNGVPRKYNWEYCTAIGMLTYLTGSVWPDIQWQLINVLVSMSIQCVCMSKLSFILVNIFCLQRTRKAWFIIQIPQEG